MRQTNEKVPKDLLLEQHLNPFKSSAQGNIKRLDQSQDFVHRGTTGEDKKLRYR